MYFFDGDDWDLIKIDRIVTCLKGTGFEMKYTRSIEIIIIRQFH